MKLKDLRAMVLAESAAGNDDLEVKIWLPGSRISLVAGATMIRQGNVLMIEGNFDSMTEGNFDSELAVE